MSEDLYSQKFDENNLHKIANYFEVINLSYPRRCFKTHNHLQLIFKYILSNLITLAKKSFKWIVSEPGLKFIVKNSSKNSKSY